MVGTYENQSILFVDDETSLTKLFDTIFKKDFTIHTSNDPLDALKLLEENEYAVVVSDYNMPNMDGMAFLKSVLEKYPHTRRILVSGDISTDLIIESLRIAKIHLVFLKPWNLGDLKKELSKQVEAFNLQTAFVENYQSMKSELETRPETISRHTDGLMDLLTNLPDVENIDDFANQYVTVIEGMKSLAILNSELYLERRDPIIFKNVMDYISDIEVIANQYDQKILAAYVLILRAYMCLIEKSTAEALQNYKATKAILHWYDSFNVEPSIMDVIEAFPENEIKAGDVTDQVILAAEIQLRRLFKPKISDLINISETLLSYYTELKPTISYFLIMRDDLPLYEKGSENVTHGIALVSGFVVALSQFLEEVIKESGDVDTINYEKGVILFHRIEDFNYVLFANSNDVRHRIGLRQVAFQTKDLLASLPPNRIATDELKEMVDKLVDENLGVF